MTSSNTEKTKIKANGNRPMKKKIKPENIILNVKKLRILRKICPETRLAAKRRPKDTALDK